MRQKNRLVRLFRALSEMTQKDFGESTGVHPVLLAQHELDRAEPSDEHLKRMARGAGLTIEAGEQILRFAETLREPRQRAGEGSEDFLAEQIASLVSNVYQRLLRLPLPESIPTAEDQHHPAELWSLAEELSEDEQLAGGEHSPVLEETLKPS